MLSIEPRKLLLCLMVPVLTVGVLVASCGREDAPPPPPVSVVRGPVLPPPAPPKPKPVTLEVLRLMPESAALAWASPPLSGVYDKAVAFAQRVAPGNVDAKAMIEEIVVELARELEVDESLSFAEILRVRGIDPDAPMAFFVDLAPTQASMAAMGEAGSEAKADGDAAKEEASEAKADAEDSESKEAGSETKAVAKTDAEHLAKALKQAEQMKAAMSQIALPAMAGVMGFTDETALVATLKEFLADQGMDVEAGQAPPETFGGVTIHSLVSGKLSYFVRDGKAVIGSSTDFLKEIAARFDNPAQIRYGTDECKAEAIDEFVELIRLDKLGAAMESAMPWMLTVNKAAVDAGMFDKAMAALKGTDPVIITFNWGEDRLEVLGRLDMTAHPDLAAMTGKAKALRLATLLPTKTLAMLSLGLTPEMKAQFMEGLSGNPPQGAAANPQAAMLAEQMKMYANLIGEEFAVGLMGFEGPFPKLIAMLELGDLDTAKTMLSMMMPGMPAETYNGVELLKLAMPLPVEVYYAYVGKTLTASTDVGELKTVIDLFQSGNKSGLFASLEPPLDADAPRYSVLLVKGELMKVLREMPVMAQQDPKGGLAMGLKKAEQVLRDVRATSEMAGDWYEQRFTISLN